MTSPDAPTPLFTHRLTVRFRDCDPLGHVNNAVYLTYLEQARFLLWRAQLGFTAKSGGEHGPGFILARVECNFRSQARYGDELDVRLSLASVGRTSFTYAYEIVDAPTGRLVASAKTVLVSYDYAAERPVPIADVLRAELARPVQIAPRPLSHGPGL
jgi:acyl-CoA thioester hydrolase